MGLLTRTSPSQLTETHPSKDIIGRMTHGYAMLRPTLGEDPRSGPVGIHTPGTVQQRTLRNQLNDISIVEYSTPYAAEVSGHRNN